MNKRNKGLVLMPATSWCSEAGDETRYRRDISAAPPPLKPLRQGVLWGICGGEADVRRSQVLNSRREIPLENMVENLPVPLQEVREGLDD